MWAKRKIDFEEIINHIDALYEKLETEPKDDKERIVTENVDSIVLSQENMDLVRRMKDDLERERQNNLYEATDILDQIRNISQKLKLPFDLSSKEREVYSRPYITEVHI